MSAPRFPKRAHDAELGLALADDDAFREKRLRASFEFPANELIATRSHCHLAHARNAVRAMNGSYLKLVELGNRHN